MDKFKDTEINEIANDILAQGNQEFEVLDDLLADNNEREFIRKELEGLIDIFNDEPYYNFLIKELEQTEDLNIYINKYFIGAEILLSIGYYKLYDNLDRVVGVYMKALSFKTKLDNEIINVKNLDKLLNLMREDYFNKRDFIDRMSGAFSVNSNQTYIKKLKDIMDKLIEAKETGIKIEDFIKQMNITKEELNILVSTANEIAFRKNNMLKINWKYTVDKLNK